MNIFEEITKHNLSVRRIPDGVVEVNEIRHRRDGDEVFTSLPSPHFPNGRQFVRRVRIPKHAGWFMVKPVNDTGSIVRWNAKEDNLAPTLEESIALFLKGKVL
jgi:hypothetical protein